MADVSQTTVRPELVEGCPTSTLRQAQGERWNGWQRLIKSGFMVWSAAKAFVTPLILFRR